MPHHIARSLASQQQRQRIDQDRLPRARLARQQVQPSAKRRDRMVDHRIIFRAQLQQHSSSPSQRCIARIANSLKSRREPSCAPETSLHHRGCRRQNFPTIPIYTKRLVDQQLWSGSLALLSSSGRLHSRSHPRQPTAARFWRWSTTAAPSPSPSSASCCSPASSPGPS